MQLPKIQQKLEEIKKEHNYDTYRDSFSNETFARGENLEQISAKLSDIRQQIDEYKHFLMNQRSEIYDEICKFLSFKGLPEYEYIGKSMKKKTSSYIDAINMKLAEKYRFNDYSFSNEMTMMEKHIKATLDKRAKSEEETKKKEEEIKLHQAILKTAEKYMNSNELQTAIALNATNEQLTKLIHERYEASRSGEEIGISCCSECDSYTMGHHRCSCGNRRISAYAEGYFFNGEYNIHITTEAY